MVIFENGYQPSTFDGVGGTTGFGHSLLVDHCGGAGWLAGRFHADYQNRPHSPEQIFLPPNQRRGYRQDQYPSRFFLSVCTPVFCLFFPFLSPPKYTTTAAAPPPKIPTQQSRYRKRHQPALVERPCSFTLSQEVVVFPTRSNGLPVRHGIEREIDRMQAGSWPAYANPLI